MDGWFEIFIPVVMGLLLIAVVMTRLQEKKRTRAIERFARDNGYEFEPVMNAERRESLRKGLSFFDSGTNQEYTNAVTFPKSFGTITVFDFKFVTGGGKSHTNHHLTVAAVVSQVSGMPALVCEPGGRWASFVCPLFHGQKDIAITGDPEFSDHYILRGPREEAVQKLFEESSIRPILKREKDLSLEAAGGLVCVFRGDRRADPVDWRRWSELGEEIYGALTRDREK